MVSSYDITHQNRATYSLDENGDATITVRSVAALNPRAVYVGEASLQFYWVHTGKSTHWQFTPTLLNPTLVNVTETVSGQEQTIQVPLGKRLFAASGLIKSNVCGEIRAPAVHFDLPCAIDLWVFILRSPQQLKVEAARQSLNITHALAQVVARLETERYGEDGALRVYVNMHGEGFNYAEVNVKRATSHASSEVQLGEVKDGGGSFSWRPQTRNFDIALSTWSSLGQGDFQEFLASLGAEKINRGLFASVNGDFVLSDGAAIQYTVTLKGDKKYIGKEEDRTELKVSAV